MQVIHFTAGATDPLEDFRARRAFDPLPPALTTMQQPYPACISPPGAILADWPCTHDSVLLLVHGEVTVTDMQYGMRLKVPPASAS